MQPRIVHVNQNISKSSVPLRLVDALRTAGLDSEILTMLSKVPDENIHVVEQPISYRIKRKVDILTHKNLKNDSNKSMPYSIMNVGIDIMNNKIIQDADIVILHWIWGHFVSFNGLKKLLDSGKKVIVYCHDNTHFTGGCHVRLGCEGYIKNCENCPQISGGSGKGYSYKQFKKKRKIYQNADFIVVSPSSWMDENVTRSALLSSKKHLVIPNPIDTEFFKPQDKKTSDKIRILFGAVNATSTPYKGYDELIAALKLLTQKYSDLGPIEAYVFGGKGDLISIGDSIEVKYLGILDPKSMVEAYNNADVYVVPSLEDSFNSTVAESLACETPVAAFATGGITDIIDHKKNGYLAEYGSVEDLADGIYWVIVNNKHNILGREGRTKVINSFSYGVIGQKYKELFNSFDSSL